MQFSGTELVNIKQIREMQFSGTELVNIKQNRRDTIQWYRTSQY